MLSLKLVQSVVVFCVIARHIQGMESDEDETNGDARIIYDQRQSGKYNIHVVIKDVAIIEMDQNEIQDSSYADDDYYYDDNDLTIKPITLNPTTPTTKLSTTSTTSMAPTKEKNQTPTKILTTQALPTIQPTTTNSDIETTMVSPTDETTTLTSSILWNTLSALISQKPLEEQDMPLKNTINETTKPKAIKTIDLKARSKIEPIFAATDDSSYLQPRYRDDSMSLSPAAKTLANSKIYKVKVHRSHQSQHYTPLKMQSRRCRSNQYRDLSGNCRIKRSHSGSLLKRLFSMLVTLPFVRGEHVHHED